MVAYKSQVGFISLVQLCLIFFLYWTFLQITFSQLCTFVLFTM